MYPTTYHEHENTWMGLHPMHTAERIDMKKILIITLSLLMVFAAVTPAVAWTQMQTQAHSIATIARAMGLAEDSPIISEASRIWWEEHQKEEQRQAEADAEFLQSHHTDAVMMAKVMFCEARGIASKRELSMICWTILNRLDAGTFGGSIAEIITTPGQFAYRSKAPMVNDHGIDLFALAQDVLLRWQAEREGQTDVGRTLPKGYCFYYGDGVAHNWFRTRDGGKGSLWFEGYENPYE